MLDRFLKIFAKDEGFISPKILSSREHGIDENLISPNAFQVVQSLQNAGYVAYIVGGGVRDLLLGAAPKDFDVATDATPEQVKACFRNAMIIGRRFRIVHVRFGREIIEVTTFRGHHTTAQTAREANQSEAGVLLRDNVYGDIQSDAVRRDFTINALYLNPINLEIMDFAGGLSDLHNRTVRMIGDPRERYKEDPVRMLRAVRFAAKLGFLIEEKTQAPLNDMGHYLQHIPAARMFDEVLKLFLGGNATATLQLLLEYHLLKHLFPASAALAKEESSVAYKLIQQVAINTDKRIRQSKRVTPAFVFAAMLWPPLQKKMDELISSSSLPPHDALLKASQIIVRDQSKHTSIPKRFLMPMRDIWNLQLRLPKRDAKRAYAVFSHQRFRAAYDFVLLREDAGEDLKQLGKWWTAFQNTDEAGRDKMIRELHPAKKRRTRRRNPRKNVQPPVN